MQRKSNRNQSGAALIMAIAATALLVGLVAAVAIQQDEANRATFNRVSMQKASRMADAGIAFAIATLSAQSNTSIKTTDAWNQLGGSPTQPGSTNYQVGNGTFRLEVLDASSKIDLNSATSAQLLKLPLTQAQVDSLLDWREPSTTARQDGAKDPYYLNLANPYLTKLAPIDSLDELLLIDGFVPATLYDTAEQLGVSSTLTAPTTSSSQSGSNEPPTISSLTTTDAISPVSATGGAKVNVNSRTFTVQQIEQKGIPLNIANQIFQRRPITRLGELLTIPGVNANNARALLNGLTVSTGTTESGKINLNTANLEVLETVPGVSSTIAQAIVNQQATGFNSITDLLTVSGVTLQLAGTFIDSFTVSSNTFDVRCVGAFEGIIYSKEAIVDFNTGKPRILKMIETPFPDMATRWQWFDVGTTTTVVDPSSLPTSQSGASS